MEIKCPGHQGIVRKDAAANTNSSLIRKHVAIIDALAFPYQWPLMSASALTSGYKK